MTLAAAPRSGAQACTFAVPTAIPMRGDDWAQVQQRAASVSHREPPIEALVGDGLDLGRLLAIAKATGNKGMLALLKEISAGRRESAKARR